MLTPRPLLLGLILIPIALLAVDADVTAQTIHVPGDFATIQEALDAAPPGTLILVAPGTYTGPLNRNLDFHGKDLELRSSAGAAATVIECSGGPESARGFCFDEGETPGAIVDGFTIHNGWAPEQPVAQGGGILCMNGSSPTILNCTFDENWSMDVDGAGGGMACLESSSPVLDHCSFVANAATIGSGLYCSASSPTVTACSFAENGTWEGYGHGAGIACVMGSSPLVEDCHFSDNNSAAGALGAGIFSAGSSPEIHGCTFFGNSAEGGGGIACTGSSVVISHCYFEGNVSDNNGGGGVLCYTIQGGAYDSRISDSVFVGNMGYYGAGVMCTGTQVTIERSTFVAQTSWYGECSGVGAADSQGGSPAQVTVDRSIIVFGDGRAADCDGASTITMTCCDAFGNADGDWVGCIAGQYGINGNISEDPLFCDMAGGDYTIDATSPCAPENSGGCGLIGALPVGCGVTAVEPTTWGAIKQAFDQTARPPR
jgi:predicted outer membrane repeat protein